MPIYEYVCRKCGHEIEQLQRLSDSPLTDCPDCGQSALKRKISASGFRLSGGGWYETDFKSDGRRNIAGDAKTNGSEGAGKDKSKNDSDKSDGGKASDQATKTDSSKQSQSSDSPAKE